MIKAPKEFTDTCRNMGPYLGEVVKTPDDLVRIALVDVGPGQAEVIVRFLDEVLNRNYSPEQLKEFWWSMPATTVFHRGEDVAVFLRLMHEMLLSPPFA